MSMYAEERQQAMAQLVADVQRTAPDLFIDRSSIFAVFSEEIRNEAGGEIVGSVFLVRRS